MNAFSQVPPGFRFHPTDEELVDYYLRKKVASKRIDLDVIKDVDLYNIEPWDLQELCRIGSEEQSDWYFFSHKDKKYPTGTRTNRATKAGFWKATGRDKPIYCNHILIGMRKTLVFYQGRAPNGQKSDWIMHEYRLETIENGTTSQEEGWVVCRVFKKRITVTQKFESPYWYEDQVSFMPHISHHQYSCNQDPFLQLPQLESPKLHSIATVPLHFDTNFMSSTLTQEDMFQQKPNIEQVTDWRVLDKFVASRLSNDDENLFLIKESKVPEISLDYASTSTSSNGQVDMWK